VKKVRDAEIKTIPRSSIVVPGIQPEVYWHDSEWQVDLVIPASERDTSKLKLTSSATGSVLVDLPDTYQQISELIRGPKNKLIVLEENDRAQGHFGIVDLKTARLIDSVGVDDALVSPDGRFIFFQIGTELPGSAQNEYRYRIYDLLKSPSANVCGFRRNDPGHKFLDPSMRGFEVFPHLTSQTPCESSDGDDDNAGMRFLWSNDASNLVFADTRNGVMSLILIALPSDLTGSPKTFVYTLKGAQDPCAGATSAKGERVCGPNEIQSLSWAGNSVSAIFRHPIGTPPHLELVIPVSRFVSLGK
jgi:hypothetical protein